MWHVYILKCADNTLYTGITTDLERRLKEHNAGKVKASKYTRSRLPVKLVYREKFATKASALKREYRIKLMAKPEKLSLISRRGKK